jgi:hypothetical protein
VRVRVVAAAQQRRLERVHRGEGQDHPDPDHQQGTPNRHACPHACGASASWAASPHASGVIPSMWTLRSGPCSRTRLVLTPCRSPGLGTKKGGRCSREDLRARTRDALARRYAGGHSEDMRLPLVVWLRGRCCHCGGWSRVREAAAHPSFGRQSCLHPARRASPHAGCRRGPELRPPVSPGRLECGACLRVTVVRRRGVQQEPGPRPGAGGAGRCAGRGAHPPGSAAAAWPDAAGAARRHGADQLPWPRTCLSASSLGV